MSVKSVRVFKTIDKDENEVIYQFKRPTQAVISKAELLSRVKFSEAFRAGIVLGDEAKKILRERGLWGDEQEKVVADLREEIRVLEEKIQDAGITNKEGLDLVGELRDKRNEINEHTRLLETVTGGTCESVAQEERNMFFAAECTFNQTTGEKVYKSLEDFKSRLDELATVESYREATIASLEMIIGQELPSDLTTQYAENEWLAERGLNEEGQDEEQDDEVVESVEVELEESKSKPKSRRSKPKPKVKAKAVKKKTTSEVAAS